MNIARPIYFGDALFADTPRYLLFDNGEPVSCATVGSCEVNVGDRHVRCAGIAGVATVKATQSRGYATALLQWLQKDLISQGFEMAALLAENPSLYERLGFVPWGATWSVSFEVTGEGGAPAPPLDLLRARPIHAEHGVPRIGSHRRSDKRWEAITQRSPLGASFDSQYLIYSPTAEGLEIRECLPAGPTGPLMRFLRGKGTITIEGWHEDIEPWLPYAKEAPAIRSALYVMPLVPEALPEESKPSLGLFPCDRF